jgi:hypothetical protein
VAAQQFIEKFQGNPLGSMAPSLSQDAADGLQKWGVEQVLRDYEWLDLKAIDRSSRFLRFIVMKQIEPLVVDGEMLPLYEPLKQPERHEDFDRAMCQAGLKKFIRPEMPSDYPIAEEAKKVLQADVVACVLVVQLAPGVRARRGINVQMIEPESAKERS